MKAIFSLIFLSLFVTFSFAQETPKPEFVDLPYYWNKESNTLITFSKETLKMKVLGMKMLYKYSGTESKTKIKSSNKISILINSSNPLYLSALKIYKLTVKKKTREAIVVTTGLRTATMSDENVIDFNSKNLEGNIYELVLSSQLDKGEYVITNGMHSYTFSVE
ncbi:MAG: Unknown protein [uncultured Aureispira sp.]|uniref:Uncharacterized protein n=1 Tax=uncultured Aureispira sp. TaxID=1331704 RepID=A0A6S6U8C3_9BACT|nr:MAG: Unknown protein [uncultured Aureispira sp.]